MDKSIYVVIAKNTGGDSNLVHILNKDTDYQKKGSLTLFPSPSIAFIPSFKDKEKANNLASRVRKRSWCKSAYVLKVIV
jgi:hypothetical protein